MSEQVRILLIQLAYPGDLLLASWIPEAIKRANPGRKFVFDWVVRKGCEWIVDTPLTRHVFSIDKSRKVISLLKTIQKIRKEKYDLVINFHRYFSSAIVSLFSKSRIKAGFLNTTWGWIYHTGTTHLMLKDIHEVDRNRGLVASVIPVAPFEHYLRKASSSYIVVAPATRLATKTMTPFQWHVFLNKLAEYLPDKNFFITGAPEDTSFIDSICAGLTSLQRFQVLCGQMSFKEVADLIKGALCLITVDSAPLHIASLWNVPSVLFYCSTAPSLGFFPLSTNFLIVETERELPCRPCGKTGKKFCPQKHFLCALSINLHKAVNKVVTFIKMLES